MSTTDDLGNIAQLTSEVAALQAQAAAAPAGPVKDLLSAQATIASNKLVALASHAQSRAEASSDWLNNMGLFSTLAAAVGNQAPTIINLFKR